MIDFCAYECERGEVQPLYACALTCRRWLPRSRLHLYHFVKLPARSHFRKFLATVKGSFVRKLDLGDIDSSSQEPVAPRKELASKYTYGDRQNSEWICLVPVYLLPHLPLLHTITLWRLPVFNAVTEKCMSQFRSYPTLKTLVLQSCICVSCQDLARLASWFLSLELLWLVETMVSLPSTGVASVYLRNLPALDSIYLSHLSNVNILESLLSWPAQKAVRRLEYICTDPAMRDRIDRFIVPSPEKCLFAFYGTLFGLPGPYLPGKLIVLYL